MYMIICTWRVGASNLKLIFISSTWDCITFRNFLSNVIKIIFKNWQVCDWLAKWLIMLVGFMDLRQPRVSQRSNIDLVYPWFLWLKGIHEEIMTWKHSSSSNFIPNRIQQYNRVCMTNITNNRVIIDIVMWFCWWPPEKPWAYQAGSH